MSDKSKIEWTEATWNPVRGCSLVSAGCTNCYAMGVAARFSGFGMPYEGLAYRTAQGPKWTGKIRLVPEALSMPTKWRRPRNIFVNSMTDLFHDGVPDEFILQVFDVMRKTTYDGGADCGRIVGNGREGHTYQLLTKRARRMRSFVSRLRWDGNRLTLDGPGQQFLNRSIWFGISAEDQATYDERVKELLLTPAIVRWISAEPLLGPIDLRLSADAGVRGRRIKWIVVGGESGPKARPMHPDWACSLRDQCAAAGVPFLFKQWGEWVGAGGRSNDLQRVWMTFDGRARAYREGEVYHPPWNTPWKNEAPESLAFMVKAGKKAAGRLLEGALHDEYPEAV